MNAKLTLNRYGAVCLNSYDVLFADIDTAAPDKGPEKPFVDPAAVPRILRDVVHRWSLCFRIYRTKCGLRLIEITRQWTPTDSRTAQLLRELSCDSLYIRLTARQKCFRSRLTPKPWRAKPPALDNWEGVEKYAMEGEYRVAAFAGHAGDIPAQVPRPVAETVDLHDRIANTHRDLPLV